MNPAYQNICLADRLARGDEELEQAILQRLVDLNHERAAEEANGKIRYLRPDFQDPENTQGDTKVKQTKLNIPAAKASISKVTKQKWPKTLPEQVAALQPLITTSLGDNPATLSATFGRASKTREKDITQILETLRALGQL